MSLDGFECLECLEEEEEEDEDGRGSGSELRLRFEKIFEVDRSWEVVVAFGVVNL